MSKLTIFKYIGLFVLILISLYSFLHFFLDIILPIGRTYLFPLMSPYLFYLRLFSICLVSFSLYRLIKHWDTSLANKVNGVSFYSNEYYVLTTSQYRWWVNPLRLVLFSLILILTVTYWNGFKTIWFNHHVIVTLTYLFILFALLIFSDEFLNIQPKYQPNIKLSYYNSRLGDFLDSYIDSNNEKLIRLISLLNILVVLCFNDYLINPQSNAMFVIYIITRAILAVNLIYAFRMASISIYFLLLMFFKPKI